MRHTFFRACRRGRVVIGRKWWTARVASTSPSRADKFQFSSSDWGSHACCRPIPNSVVASVKGSKKRNTGQPSKPVFPVGKPGRPSAGFGRSPVSVWFRFFFFQFFLYLMDVFTCLFCSRQLPMPHCTKLASECKADGELCLLDEGQ